MPPKILYKYLSFSGGLKTLKNTSLRYRHPNEFNDPFEFMPGGYTGDTQEERLRRTIDLLCTNPQYRELYNSRNGTSFSQFEWNELIQSNDPKVRDFTSIEFANRIFDGLQQRDWCQFRDNASKNVVFCSFSQNEKDILMWAHYADEHSGIVIGFDSSYFGNLHKVKYDKKRILIPLSSTVSNNVLRASVEQIMTTKSLQWKYEEEWRQILSSREIEGQETLLLKAFPVESVLAVIFGYRMLARQKEEIQATFPKYPNLKTVMQARLHQRDFALEITAC